MALVVAHELGHVLGLERVTSNSSSGRGRPAATRRVHREPHVAQPGHGMRVGGHDDRDAGISLLGNLRIRKPFHPR